MNDELKSFAFQFIIHRSAFIIVSDVSSGSGGNKEKGACFCLSALV